MPVTIQVAQHAARPVDKSLRTGPVETKDGQTTSHLVLTTLAGKNAGDIGAILTTNLGPQTSLPDATLSNMAFSVQDHGLVRAAYHAYSSHHHLVLRPEDVWCAILTQFSFFVNANAEKLRASFVAHGGKKGLILRDPGQPDMGLMCRNMTKLIDENIVDPALRSWILPSFSTTTPNDEVVAAIIMMGTLQKYFDYVMSSEACGIPSVTLLGTQNDWEDIARRIEKLAEYGDEPTWFCGQLRPILRGIVASFSSPAGDAAVVDFWSRMVNRDQGSGMDYLTGWLVAFCFWDEDGKCFYKHSDALPQWPQYNMFDGVTYHTVDYDCVPAGHVSVPVTYVSPDSVLMEAKLLAGFVGFEATTAPVAAAGDRLSATGAGELTTTLDTLRPITGWWMYEIKSGRGRSAETKAEDETIPEILQGRLQNMWNGQASTGYVQRDQDTVVVEPGLPRY